MARTKPSPIIVHANVGSGLGCRCYCHYFYCFSCVAPSWLEPSRRPRREVVMTGALVAVGGDAAVAIGAGVQIILSTGYSVRRRHIETGRSNKGLLCPVTPLLPLRRRHHHTMGLPSSACPGAGYAEATRSPSGTVLAP